MYIKIVSSVLIIVLSWCGGFVISRVYIDRVRELKEFEKLLFALSNQISYGMTPIPQAVRELRKNTVHPIDCFLEDFEGRLSRRDMSMEAAWKNSFLLIKDKLNLKAEDSEIIIWFGKQLGNVDKETQLQNIEFTMARIKRQREYAEESRDKKGRLYKSLGLALGMFISVIII